MTLATRLTQAREKAGLSKTELAARAKVTISAISQAESGLTKNIRLENFYRIVEALDCDGKWLATGKMSSATAENAAYSVNTAGEAELLRLYNELDDAARQHLIQTGKMLAKRLVATTATPVPPVLEEIDEEDEKAG